MVNPVGIEQIGIYSPEACIKTETLAPVRGEDSEKISKGLGIHAFAVPMPWEDAVTMAANAAEHLFSAGTVDRSGIGRVVVATESAMDGSKPIAAYLHSMLGLRPSCEAFDVKFACVAGMYALLDALRFVRANGGKALVVATDISVYGPVGSAEFTQGAGAVALLVSGTPDLLEIEPEMTGTFTRDENDFYRPFGKVEAVVQGKYSVDCYLRALNSVEDYCEKAGEAHLFRGECALSSMIFHTPYPRLPVKALRRVLERHPVDAAGEAALLKRLELAQKASGLIGNAYTAAVFFAMSGLLVAEGSRLVGERLGIYTYGSGSGSKFMVGRFGKRAGDLSHLISRCHALENRRSLSVSDYEELFFHQQLPTSGVWSDEGGWRIREIDSTGYRWYSRS